MMIGCEHEEWSRTRVTDSLFRFADPHGYYSGEGNLNLAVLPVCVFNCNQSRPRQSLATLFSFQPPPEGRYF